MTGRTHYLIPLKTVNNLSIPQKGEKFQTTCATVIFLKWPLLHTLALYTLRGVTLTHHLVPRLGMSRAISRLHTPSALPPPPHNYWIGGRSAPEPIWILWQREIEPWSSNPYPVTILTEPSQLIP